MGLPSRISKVSKNKSSNLTRAKASSTSKPKTNALTKSAAFCSALISVVSSQDLEKVVMKYKIEIVA